MTDLRPRAEALKLHGLIAHWNDVHTEPWIEPLIDWEEQERSRRGFERRLREARLGAFKPIADFDWSWPTKIDRALIDDLFRLDPADWASTSEPRNGTSSMPQSISRIGPIRHRSRS